MRQLKSASEETASGAIQATKKPPIGTAVFEDTFRASVRAWQERRPFWSRLADFFVFEPIINSYFRVKPPHVGRQADLAIT
jgi:hypothetical protein